MATHPLLLFEFTCPSTLNRSRFYLTTNDIWFAAINSSRRDELIGCRYISCPLLCLLYCQSAMILNSLFVYVKLKIFFTSKSLELANLVPCSLMNEIKFRLSIKPYRYCYCRVDSWVTLLWIDVTQISLLVYRSTRRFEGGGVQRESEVS